ncbi:hypothetical protein KSP40_PGU000828 [Platanthera guangdongensis]|uniref:Uncharacterized protein n=1 Tax=Platanthera guangdongensis TaxID=2320717 RepID=A0ABR2LIK5_9ASPA
MSCYRRAVPHYCRVVEDVSHQRTVYDEQSHRHAAAFKEGLQTNQLCYRLWKRSSSDHRRRTAPFSLSRLLVGVAGLPSSSDLPSAISSNVEGLSFEDGRPLLQRSPTA